MAKTETAAAHDETPIREVRPLPATSVAIAEARRVTHHLVLPAGMTLDDLQLPEIWINLASKLHRHDLIEVTDEAGSMWALMLVREVGPEHARIEPLLGRELAPLYESIDDLPLHHRVHYLGPKRRWGVLHDKRIIKHGFTTKTDAANWAKAVIT